MFLDSDNAVIKEENIDTDIFLSNEIMKNEQSSETDVVEEKTESDEELYTSNDSENECAGSDWETGLYYIFYKILKIKFIFGIFKTTYCKMLKDNIDFLPATILSIVNYKKFATEETNL